MSRTLSLTALIVFGYGRLITAKEIPLNQVWAYDMPDTRSLSDRMRDGKFVSEEGPIVVDILRSLDTEEAPKQGFAVSGIGMSALRKARAIMLGELERTESIAADSQVSVFFFAQPYGGYVHLKEVEKKGTAIEVRYQFVPHQTRNPTAHFALIPMGRLHPGKYDVRFVQLKIEEKFSKWGFGDYQLEWEKVMICRNFSFEVSDQPRQ